MSLRVLLVEDDRQLAAQLSSELVAYGHTVATAVEGHTALSLVAQQPFDAVVLDWMLPSVDGLAVLRELRGSGMKLPVLMLTALGQTYDKVQALETGADDYVVKPVDAAELNARLNALMRARRTNVEAGDTLSVGDIVVSPSRLTAWRRGQMLALGQTEFKILVELARNAGTVVTRQMLLEKVWGYDFVPATNIVEAHIRRLRAKLMQHGDDPIRTLRGAGYALGE